MQIDINKLLEIGEKYPESIFRSENSEFEAEDKSFARFNITNANKLTYSRTMRLEIIFKKDPPEEVYGHYIRFYNLRNKIGRILPKIKRQLGMPKLYFSDDFIDAGIISSDEKMCLRLQQRELNYYLTHLSISFEDNVKTHEQFITEIKKNFFQINHLPNVDRKSQKSIRKLFEKIFGHGPNPNRTS